MIILRHQPALKKPVGAYVVNFGHPLATGIVSVCLFNESPQGGINQRGFWDAAQNKFCGTLTSNLATNMAYAPEPGGFGWDPGSSVQVRFHVTTNESTLPLLADRITVLAIRYRKDTTLRTAALCGTGSGTGTQFCRVNFDTSGNLFWDFGGGSAPNRLTIAGQSWPVQLDMFAFRAGGKGSAAWRNGKLLGSQSTALTRTITGNYWAANNSVGVDGDVQTWHFFATFNAEWSDDMIAWWFEEPYGMLLPETSFNGIIMPENYIPPTISSKIAGQEVLTPVVGGPPRVWSNI